MFFLMRVAFWLCIVLALLPTGGSKQGTQASTTNNDFNVVEAFSAATATDMRRFCDRQPDACAVGSQAAVTFGQRAQAGAKMVYEFLNERMAPQETGSVSAHNAPTKPAAGAAAAKASQNTLTQKDLIVPWRGPVAREAATGRRPV